MQSRRSVVSGAAAVAVSQLPCVASAQKARVPLKVNLETGDVEGHGPIMPIDKWKKLPESVRRIPIYNLRYVPLQNVFLVIMGDDSIHSNTEAMYMFRRNRIDEINYWNTEPFYYLMGCLLKGNERQNMFGDVDERLKNENPSLYYLKTAINRITEIGNSQDARRKNSGFIEQQLLRSIFTGLARTELEADRYFSGDKSIDDTFINNMINNSKNEVWEKSVAMASFVLRRHYETVDWLSAEKNPNSKGGEIYYKIELSLRKKVGYHIGKDIVYV